MGRFFWGIPQAMTAALLAASGVRYAVETGTYSGESADWLRARVDHLWTVERDCELAEGARRRFDPFNNVTVVEGSAPEALEHMLPSIGAPALFWLDAHWFRGLPDDPAPQCTIVRELEMIERWPHALDSVVLIDDAALMSVPLRRPYRGEEWPGLLDVMLQLRELGYERVTLVDDVIVAGPSQVDAALQVYVESDEYTGPY